MPKKLSHSPALYFRYPEKRIFFRYSNSHQRKAPG